MEVGIKNAELLLRYGGRGGESAEVTHVSLCGDMRSDKSLEGEIEGWSKVVEVERNTRIE